MVSVRLRTFGFRNSDIWQKIANAFGGTFILSVLENPKHAMLVIFALIVAFAGVILYLDTGNKKGTRIK